MVSRDPALVDNTLLPAAHARRVGEFILTTLCDKNSVIGPVVPPEISRATVLVEVKKLMDLFEINDYCLTYRVSSREDGFDLVLVAPATLWSQQVLGRRRDLPNDFEAMTVSAFLRRCSVPATYTTSLSGAEVTHRFQYPKNLAL